MSSIRKPNLARTEGRGSHRWLWAALTACGCMQWPSLEHDGLIPTATDPPPPVDEVLPGAESATLASAEAAQSQPEQTPSDAVLWQTRLGSERAPQMGAGLSASEGVAFAVGAVTSDEVPSSSDASLAAYSSSDGALLWTRQLGSPEADAANASASSGDRVLIAGQSAGALGGPAQGFGDAFVAAYSATGELLWTRQIGSPQPDAALGVSIDASGAVLVVGDTRGVLAGERDRNDRDAFLAKLGPDGELIYARQLGSGPGLDEIATGVATDASGDVVLAGHTFGGVGGDGNGSADAFVARYSSAGELLWTAQLGGEDFDAAEAVGVDASGASYVAGQTGGSIVGGPGVVFGGRPLLAKYSPVGELLWSVELEDAEMGAASAVAIDARGDVWIAGRTAASFAAPNQGGFDSFVARFSADGARLSALQPGVTDGDRAVGLAWDGEHLVLLSRATQIGEVAFDYALLTGIENEP